MRQPITLLVHGSGSGADVLCDSWARRRKIPIKIHQADCDKRGADAWVVRNSEMLKEKPDLVIAFSSSNTTCDCDMLKKCQSKFIPIIFGEYHHAEATIIYWAEEALARLESARAEQAKLITSEWCLSHGAKYIAAGDQYVFECGVIWTPSGVYYDHRGRDPWRHATALPEIKTCGQLSDLINALKGGES